MASAERITGNQEIRKKISNTLNSVDPDANIQFVHTNIGRARKGSRGPAAAEASVINTFNQRGRIDETRKHLREVLEKRKSQKREVLEKRKSQKDEGDESNQEVIFQEQGDKEAEGQGNKGDESKKIIKKKK